MPTELPHRRWREIDHRVHRASVHDLCNDARAGALNADLNPGEAGQRLVCDDDVLLVVETAMWVETGEVRVWIPRIHRAELRPQTDLQDQEKWRCHACLLEHEIPTIDQPEAKSKGSMS